MLYWDVAISFMYSIEVKNLTKKFRDLSAVDDISFSVQKGEFFAFLGPNGAGKTTTIKMLTTILEPTAGELFLEGVSVREKPAQVRHLFGIVFQDPSLDNELTAYENMKYHAILYGLSKELYTKRIKELLDLVQLWERKDTYVKNFSGGMKRRLEIARGLLHHPKVLFLDEPTIGLDPQTRNLIWNYIKDLNKKEGITVFFTTHHMEEVDRMSERLAIIDQGKIIAQGSPEDLRRKTGAATLEEAFISLTGSEIREEVADVGKNQMRIGNKMMR